jgi:hypothetical protein
LEKLFKGINAFLEKKCFDENAFMEITNNNAIKFPSCKPVLNIETLMNLGDLQFVLSFLAGHINIFNELVVIKEGEKKDESLQQIEDDYHTLRRWLESTDMHVFLAAWNLWDKPHRPYIINFLLRATDLEAFHMLLTEDFLGTFYMVSFTNLMIQPSLQDTFYILFKIMYVGLIQPERYTNHSLGYMEFLHRLADEKIHKDPIPPLAEFVDLAREQLDQVSLL